MTPRPGWRFLGTSETAFVHEWRPQQTPQATGMVLLQEGRWRWRVSFWNDTDVWRSKRNNAPLDSADQAMQAAEAVIFATGTIVR